MHCYWTHGQVQTYSQARQTCTNEDGHLVTILSEEENLFVVSIAQFSPMYSDTWIGASDGRAGSDERGVGTYTWVTGEAWGYANWASGAAGWRLRSLLGPANLQLRSPGHAGQRRHLVRSL